MCAIVACEWYWSPASKNIVWVVVAMKAERGNGNCVIVWMPFSLPSRECRRRNGEGGEHCFFRRLILFSAGQYGNILCICM